jgi:cell division transport system ATP-binding protein
MRLVRFENVYKTYKNSYFSLSNINLEIKEGEFVFIIGKTGSGKSTLLKLIYGEERPENGKIILFGTDLAKADSRQIRKERRRTGLVFQDGGLIDDRNVYENVAYPLYIQDIGRETVKKRVSIALRLVDMISKKGSYPKELSGGEKQKACIARAIVSDPQLMIADEPTGNIDAEAAKDIMGILGKISEKGTAVIVATHDMDMVRGSGKRTVEISTGTIIKDSAEGYIR